MLRVTVELVPFGDESQARVLDVMVIENVTKDFKWDNSYGRVADYKVHGHSRRAGFWELIRAALNVQAARPTLDELRNDQKLEVDVPNFSKMGMRHYQPPVHARPSLCLLLYREAIKNVLEAYDFGKVWVVGSALSGTDKPGEPLVLAVSAGEAKASDLEIAKSSVLLITGVNIEIGTVADLYDRNPEIFGHELLLL